MASTARKPRTTKQTRHALEQETAATLDLTLFGQLAYLMALDEIRGSTGRVPSLDDLCNRCVFEFGIIRAFATFAYLVTEELVWEVKEGKRQRIHAKSKRRRVFAEVHMCPYHQSEVTPYRDGLNEYDPFLLNTVGMAASA